MDHSVRREALAARLGELEVDALLISRLPNVRYLTGYTGSNGQLLLATDRGVFFTDFRYEEQSRREVPDLERVLYMTGFPEYFAKACADIGVARVGFESEGVTYRSYRELAETAQGVELVEVGPEVERLRWVKDEEEHELLRRAQAITDAAFENVVGKLGDGITEAEVAFGLEVAMRAAGAQGVAFDSIVAFGDSAAEPHHRPTDRPLRRGDLAKLDFGCVVDGYHSDMTRTVAFGEPGAGIRELYEIVRAAQAAGQAAIRAGVEGRVADLAARAVIAEAGYGDRFGHSLGHGVGLEIHEGPTLRKSSDDVLPAGAVVTVEPGIYLPGKGGVRIEDMVRVTEEGAEALPATTRDLLVV